MRGSDPAEVNALLVGAGIPVTGLALERPTLEEVVLAAAGTSTDRVEVAPVIAVELRKLFRRPRTWATIGRPQRAADRWWRCCWPSPTWRRGPGRGRRSCPPSCATARCTRSPRWPSCCRCSCRSRSPSSRATRSPARRRPARCATCSPGRRAAPGCWSPSWSPSWPSCSSPCVVVAAVGYVHRADAVRRPADRRDVGVGHVAHAGASWPAARCSPSATWRCRCSGWRRSRCSSPR